MKTAKLKDRQYLRVQGRDVGTANSKNRHFAKFRPRQIFRLYGICGKYLASPTQSTLRWTCVVPCHVSALIYACADDVIIYAFYARSIAIMMFVRARIVEQMSSKQYVSMYAKGP